MCQQQINILNNLHKIKMFYKKELHFSKKYDIFKLLNRIVSSASVIFNLYTLIENLRYNCKMIIVFI